MHLDRLLLAFRLPVYRWLWASNLTEATGFMPFMLAQGWVILEITGSPFMVGLAPGLGGVANMLFSPFGGVLVDRFNRRTILMLAQIIMAAAILILGLLFIAGVIEVWHILIISMVQRTMMGLQLTARNTLMYNLVGPKVFMNAMAGQFMSVHIATIIGPLAAGFILAAFGAGPLFLVISSVIFLSAILLLPVPSGPRTERPAGSVWLNLREGVSFAMGNRPIRIVMWTVLITDGLGYSSWSMFPVVTRDILDAGPVVLGLLSTFLGTGGLIGTLALSSFGDFKPKGWVFIGAAFCFGAFLVLFAFSRSLPLSLALILLTGASAVTYDILAHTLLMSLTPDAMRGRIMGLYTFLMSGISLGSLALGTVASWLGVKWALTGSGGIIATNALRVTPMAQTLSEKSTLRPE